MQQREVILDMGGATKTSTRLVNETDKVLHLYVESAGENYFFKRTLKVRRHEPAAGGAGAADWWFVEEFDANCTYRKMRVFEDAGNRVTDVSISSDDMIDYREIAITVLSDGSFALRCTPRFVSLFPLP